MMNWKPQQIEGQQQFHKNNKIEWKINILEYAYTYVNICTQTFFLYSIINDEKNDSWKWFHSPDGCIFTEAKMWMTKETL